ncbi:hypothetical protein N7537_004460 [Penicillium hordei]|uniref:Myb-like domain-containing protein n=1 Tax=Penicillium hordei TaxID=40994 RepID=A0AAD6H4X3_9EURO|nr:uncharacterized protein N7537_004460 [Penicillium hordei]KAJ5607841.1 hypothetical protein N7537_004460 [Penicillium hordei]
MFCHPSPTSPSFYNLTIIFRPPNHPSSTHEHFVITMASIWSHERDKQLLVAILAVHSPLDCSAIAKAMGQGDSTAAVRQHLYTLKARHEGTSAKSPTKDNTDNPTGRGRKSTKTTAKRKTASVTQSEKDTVAESQDEHGDESAFSSTK